MASTVSRDSTSFMMYPTEYYLRELFNTQEQNLPLLVYIRDGYHGNSEVETIASGQYIYIRGISRQTRVIAKDKSGRFQNNLLSIPKTFPIPFQVSGEKNQKYAKRISDFIDGAKFPVHVEMCGSTDSKFIVGDKSAYACDFKLILTDTFTERYFIANCLFEDTRRLDKHTIPLPLYLPNVKLSVVYGFEKGGYGEWETFMKSLEIEAQHAYGMIEQFGDEDIAILSPGSESVGLSNPVYEYIEPNAYMSLVLTEYSSISEPAYDLLAEGIDGIKPVHDSIQKENTQLLPEHKETSHTQPVFKHEQTNVVLLTQPFPEDKQILQTPPLPKHKPASRIQRDPKHKQTMKTRTFPEQKQKMKNQQLPEKRNSMANENKTMRQSSYDSLLIEFNNTKIKLNDVEKTQPPPVPEKPFGYKNVKGVSSATENNVMVMTEPLPPEGVIAQETAQFQDSSESQENVYGELPGDSTYSYNASRNISSYVNTDAPNDCKLPMPISMMTVDDVANVLSRLSLDKYVQVFQEQMIDGPILLDLDKEILADFGFKKIEILRLMKYIKSGHIPI